MFISLDPGAFPPTRAHATDAGLDIKSPVKALVRAHGYFKSSKMML